MGPKLHNFEAGLGIIWFLSFHGDSVSIHGRIKSACSIVAALRLSQEPLAVMGSVWLPNMPARLQENNLKWMHGNAVIAAMSAGMGIVVAVPVLVIQPVSVGVVHGHEGGNAEAMAEEDICETVLAAHNNTIITELACPQMEYPCPCE